MRIVAHYGKSVLNFKLIRRGEEREKILIPCNYTNA